MTPAHLDARRRKDLPRRASLYGAAFLLPVALLCLLSAMRGVYPFGPESFLTEDLKYQYIDFFHWYRKVLTGQESLFYSFSTSLGNNAWGLWSYYLASPLNLIILLFPEELLTLAIFVISAVKLGLTGVTTSLYLRRRFSLGRSSTLALSLCFACSLWSMTQLRNPLWMDAVVLLPLVALGAWRCVTSGRWGTLAASLVPWTRRGPTASRGTGPCWWRASGGTTTTSWACRCAGWACCWGSWAWTAWPPAEGKEAVRAL